MENKKESSLLTILLTVIIILLSVAGFIFYLNNKKEPVVDDTPNNNAVINVGTKVQLGAADAENLYLKALYSPVFVQLLILNSDDARHAFTDKEIKALLPNLGSKDETNVFNRCSDCEENEDCFCEEATNADAQKLAKKYFGREIADTSEKVQVEVPSGFGIMTSKVVAAYKLNDGTYAIEFETSAEEVRFYTLYVDYNEATDSVVYKEIERNN